MRGVRFEAWYLLLVAVIEILNGCQSLRDLERSSIRPHAVLTEDLYLDLLVIVKSSRSNACIFNLLAISIIRDSSETPWLPRSQNVYY